MIKIGCAGTHPEDVLFFSSDAVRQWMARNARWDFYVFQDPLEEPSVDVLLLPADMMNKHNADPRLDDRPWIMLSSNKADAWRAWQLGAVFFLLRPLSLTDFERALARAEQCHYWRRGQLPPNDNGQPLELMLTKGRRLAVQNRDILFLEAQGEVTRVHLTLPGQEKVVATRNLGYWEGQLDERQFLRVHKKFLVNMEHVSSLNADEIQVQEFQLPVAKRRRRDVEKHLHSYKML